MILEDIIAAISANLQLPIVLHKKLSIHPKFKACKCYSYLLYKVGEEQELLLEWDAHSSSSISNVEDTWLMFDKEYLPILVNWISSDEYKRLKK